MPRAPRNRHSKALLKDIGLQFRDARELFTTFTQKGWAACLDVSEITLNRLECGKSGPSLDTICRYANELGCDIKVTLVSRPGTEIVGAKLKRRKRQKPRELREITYDGKTQNAVAWSRETGISRSTISWRLRHGWKPEDILRKSSRKSENP